MLRPYQQSAVAQLRENVRDRPVLAMPTGGGKTHVAAEIVRLAVDRGKRVLFLVHRRELVDQAQRRFAAFGVESGAIIATRKEDRSRAVQVASVQTLHRRAKPPADIVIVDEAHHVAAKIWLDVLDHYAGSYLIGLTATPFRLDGTGLGNVFGSIVEPVRPRELCEAGVLVEPRVFSHPSGHNVAEGVRKQRGDYAVGQLGERMTQAKLLGDIVDHWERHECRGKRTVAFAVNVAHSEAIAAEFQARGYLAAHLDGKTPKDERAAVLDMLDRGEIDVLSNCMLLGEGWDLPALEVAILARPTASLALHCQQVGRVVRASPDKDGALVLDHAGNYLEHGNPFDVYGFDLDSAPKREKGEAGPKTCPACYCVCEPTDLSCPECGHVFKQEHRETEHEIGELEEYREHPAEFRRAVYLAFVLEANERRYSLGWARYRYKDKIGKWPRNMRDIEEDNYQCYAHDVEEKEYGPRRVVRCRLCYRELDSCVAI